MLEEDFEKLIRTDERLQGSLLASQAPRFWRYYDGFLRDGRREIIVSFGHQSYVTRDEWFGDGSSTLRFAACGGGELFWDLTYDVQSRRFIEIRHNGDM